MVRSPSYEDLLADGAALRGRLQAIGASSENARELVRDIRSWEVRCATAVAVRNPGRVAAFRGETGSFHRLPAEATPLSGAWRTWLDDSLSGWLRALRSVARNDATDARAARKLAAE